jgi:hypothetical protein
VYAFLCLFLLASAASEAQSSASAASDKQVAARAEALRVVDAWLDSVQAYRHIPALSVGVVVGDDLVWSKGYGTLDAGHKIPAAPEEPAPWGIAVYAILDKRKGYEFKAPAPASGVNLEDFAGHYSKQPWGSESAMFPWTGGLVSFSLPSEDPVGDMQFYKPKGGDVFRRVRDDGSEAEELTFTRDASGKVTGFTHFSNPTIRMPAN